jgi:hypothetical protein
MTNVLSTLRTFPDLCKNVSLAVLFGSNGSSYTISTHSDMCIYVYILHNIVTVVGKQKQTKKKKIGATVNAASRLGTRVIGLPTLFGYPD